jgi:serine/threonine protein kinase
MPPDLAILVGMPDFKPGADPDHSADTDAVLTKRQASDVDLGPGARLPAFPSASRPRAPSAASQLRPNPPIEAAEHPADNEGPTIERSPTFDPSADAVPTTPLAPPQMAPYPQAAPHLQTPPPPQAASPEGVPPPGTQWVTNFHFRRSRTYAFVVDANGRPIEIGSGRYGRIYLGQERWNESLTDLMRPVVIKMMHRGLGEDERARFQMEKSLLELVQGHPAIIELLGSGASTDPRLPPAIQAQCEGDFMILEKLDMSLEERLKGTRDPRAREDLLALDMHDRLLRVLEYILPVASAIEHAHLVRNVCHRDINPSNVLLKLPDPHLAGSSLQVRLADFSVAKMDASAGITQFAHAVPGTMFFQSPEQEMHMLELLVSVEQGSAEVEYFEDFFINIARNDTFAIFNRPDEYVVLHNDRVRKRLVLHAPYREPSEKNIRAHVQKSVGRPADIYSLGALFYYLVSGSIGNPKTLHDAFKKFIEYDAPNDTNLIETYLNHEYEVVSPVRVPSPNTESLTDRSFAYRHYFDGNGELIHYSVMAIIARSMIRNKRDSYCQSYDLETAGITTMVRDLTNLYLLYGINMVPRGYPLGGGARQGTLAWYGARGGEAISRMYTSVASMLRGKK